MRIKKVLVIAGLALAIFLAVVSVIAVARQEAALAKLQQKTGLKQTRHLSHRTEPSVVPEKQQATEAGGIEGPASPTELGVATPHVQPPPVPKKAAPQSPIRQPGAGKAPPLDPMARAALSFVGRDAEAEEYWAEAINDPGLPGEERQDLIEDLNEDGLSDAKHPGPEDMPLIVNRLEIIEELAPFAIDRVNADAFAEAHKDLLSMLNGQPVQ